MVRETRHLWVGNLPDNIREERILEHFKRYGRVQSVKLLAKKDEENGVCATVAFIDIKSASKAQSAENKIDERTLKTDYYEPTTPSTASAAIHIHERDDSLLRTHPAQGLYPPPPARNQRYSHGLPEERAYDRSSHYYERAPDRDAYMRRSMSYHEDELYQGRGRPRERAYRGGATATGYQAPVDRTQTHFRSHNARQHFDQQRYPPAEQYAEDRDSSSGRLSRRSSPGRTKTRKNRSCSHSGTESRSGSQSSSGSRSSSSSTDSRSSSSSSESSQSQTQSESRSKSRSRSPSKAGRGSDKPSSVATTPVPQLQSAVSAPTPVSLCTTVGNASFNNSNSMDSTTGDKEDKRPLGICVRNLPVRSSDTSLKDGLFHEYKKHGKVTMVKVIGQGTERYAVVCFKKPEDVEKAMEVSKDKLFFGSKIEVTLYEGVDVDDNEFRPLEAELDEYHPKATRTLFIGNLEKDITAAELRKHFEQFGEIIEIDIKKQGAVSSYAFVQYSDISSVVKAMRKMDGEHLGANRIKLGFGKSMPTTCVWLDGIADTVTEKFLARQFHRFGPVSYTVVDREKGHALIFYDRMDFAQVAVSEMRGRALGGKKLQIDFASRECQMAFYEKMEMTGQQIPTDRPWDRREQNFDNRDDREIRIGYENHGRGYTRFESSQRGRGNYRGTQRGNFNNRGRGTQVFTNRVVDDDYSQGSGASYDDSYEQELRDYGVSQRERRDYSGEDRSTRDRSFSPVRKVERSLSPHERLHDDRSISPPAARIVETQRRSDRSFERYDSGREEEVADDKKTKYYGMLLRRKQRQRSVSDQDSFHSQSPPNSRHHSRSASPPLVLRPGVSISDKRLKEKLTARPRSPGTPTDSPGRDSPFDPALDGDPYIEMLDSMKRKLPEGKSDLRDPLPKGGEPSPFENACGVNSNDASAARPPRTKVELDRSRFRKVHSAPGGDEECKADLADYPSELRRASLASLDGDRCHAKEHRTLSRLPEGGKLQSVVSCISRLPRSVPVVVDSTCSVEKNKPEMCSPLPPLTVAGDGDSQRTMDKEKEMECGELVDDGVASRPVTTDKDLTHLQNKKVHLLHLIEQLDASGSSGDDDHHGRVLGGLLTDAGRFPPNKRQRLADMKLGELSKESIRSLLEIGRDTKEILLPSLEASNAIDAVDPVKTVDCGAPHRKTSSTDLPKVQSRANYQQPPKAKRPPLERMEVLRGGSVSSVEGDVIGDSVLELTCKRPKHGVGLHHDDVAKPHLHHQAKLRDGYSLEVTCVVSSMDDEPSSVDKYSSLKGSRTSSSSSHHSIPPPLLPKSALLDGKLLGCSLGEEPKRDRDCPLSLPLPRFANAVLSPKHSPKQLLSPKLGNIKSPPPPPPLPSPHRRHSISLSPSSSGQGVLHKDVARTPETAVTSVNVLLATPTSPSSSNALSVVDSPDPVKESEHDAIKTECPSPPRPLHKGNSSSKTTAGSKSDMDSSSDSEHTPLSSPTRLSLEERIRMLDEKYNAWSGSAHSLTSTSIGGSGSSSNAEASATSAGAATVTTTITTASTTVTTTSKIDYEKYTIKRRPMLLSTDITRTEPSEIVKSLLAKSSIFDQDSKRLEHINEKYEPKDLPPPELMPKVNRCFRTKAAAKEFFPVQNQSSPDPSPSKLATTFPNSILCKQQSLPTSLMTTTSVLTTTSPSQIHSATALMTMSGVSTVPSITSPIPTSLPTLPILLQNPPFLTLSQSAVPFSPKPAIASAVATLPTATDNSPKVSATLSRKSSDPTKPSLLKRESSSSSSCAISPSSASGKASCSPLHTVGSSSISPCSLTSPAAKKECPLIPPKKELHGILVKRESKEQPSKECPTPKKESSSSSSCKDHVKKEDGSKCLPSSCAMSKESGRKDSFCSSKDGSKKDSGASGSACSKDGHSRKDVSGCGSSKEAASSCGGSYKETGVKKESSHGSTSKESHSVKKEVPSQVNIANKKRMTSTDSTESESGKSAKSDKLEQKADKESTKAKSESRSLEPESKKAKLSSSSSVEERSKKNSNPNHANPGSVSKKSSKSPPTAPATKVSGSNSSSGGKTERKDDKKSSSDGNDREKNKSSGSKQQQKDDKKAKGSGKDNGSESCKSKTKSESSSSSSSSSKSKDSEKKGKDEKKKKDKDKDKEKSKDKKNGGSDKSKSGGSGGSGDVKVDKKMENLFSFVDDEPVYFSMYDKVKARSSQNEKAKEKEKELETVREKFNQLKQSRAKREEKSTGKSTSADYDSDKGSEGGSSHHSSETSESKTSSSKGKQAKKRKLVIESSSSDEDTFKDQRKYSKKGSHYQRKKSDSHHGSSAHFDHGGGSGGETPVHDGSVKTELPSSSSSSSKKDKSKAASESSRRIQLDVDSSDNDMQSMPSVTAFHASPIMEQTSGKKQKSKGRKKQEKEQCKLKTAKKKSPRAVSNDHSDAESTGGGTPRTKGSHASKSSKAKKAKAMMMLLNEQRAEDHTSDSDAPITFKRSPALHHSSSQQKESPKEHHDAGDADGHSRGQKGSSSTSKTTKKEKQKKEHQMKFVRADSSEGEAPAVDEPPVVKKRKNKTSKKEKNAGDKSRSNKVNKEGSNPSKGSRMLAREVALKSDDESPFALTPRVAKTPEWKDGDGKGTKGDYDFVVSKSDDERLTNFRHCHPSTDEDKLLDRISPESKDASLWLESMQHPLARDSYPYIPSPVNARPPKEEPPFDKLEPNPFDFYSDVEAEIQLPKKEEKRKKNKKDKNREKRRKSKTDSDKNKESAKSKSSSAFAVAPVVTEPRDEYTTLSISDHGAEEYTSKNYSQVEEAVKALEWHLQEIHDESPRDGLEAEMDDRIHDLMTLPPTPGHCYRGDFGLGMKDSRLAPGGPKSKDKLCSAYDVFDFKEEGSSDFPEAAVDSFASFGDSKDLAVESESKSKRPRKKRKQSKEERPKRAKLDSGELHDALAMVTPAVPDAEDDVSHNLATLLEAEPLKEEKLLLDSPSPKSPLHTVDAMPLAVDPPPERAKSVIDDFIPELLQSSVAECLQEPTMEPFHVTDKCEPDHLDLVEEKGTAISQEETEDAVKALLECFDSDLLDEPEEKMEPCDDSKSLQDHDSLFGLEMLESRAKNMEETYEDDEEVKPDTTMHLSPARQTPSPVVEPEASFEEPFGREPDMEPLTTPSSEGDQLVIDEHPPPTPENKDEMAAVDEGSAVAGEASQDVSEPGGPFVDTASVTPTAATVTSTPARSDSPTTVDMPELDLDAFSLTSPQPEPAPVINPQEEAAVEEEKVVTAAAAAEMSAAEVTDIVPVVEEKPTISSEELPLPNLDALDMPLLDTDVDKPNAVLTDFTDAKLRKKRRVKTRKYSEPGLGSLKGSEAMATTPPPTIEVPVSVTPPRHGSSGIRRGRPASAERPRRGSRANLEEPIPDFVLDELLPTETDKIAADDEVEAKPAVDEVDTKQTSELPSSDLPAAEVVDTSEAVVENETPVEDVKPPVCPEITSECPEDPPMDIPAPPANDVETTESPPVLKVPTLMVSTVSIEEPVVLPVAVVSPVLVKPAPVVERLQEVVKQDEPKKVVRRGRKKKCDDNDKVDVSRPDDNEEVPHHHQREPRFKTSHLELRTSSESKRVKETSPFDVFEFRDEEEEDIGEFATKFGGDHGGRHADDKKFAVPAAVDASGSHEHEASSSVGSVNVELQHHAKEERDTTTAVERSRPRLILTIKSPHKDSHERIPKVVETREEPPLRFAEAKVVEEPHGTQPVEVGSSLAPAPGDPPQSNTSPGRLAATRKSQRLQEKCSRTTIDETIEDVVKGHFRPQDATATSTETENPSATVVARRTRSKARAEEAAHNAAAALPTVVEPEVSSYHAIGAAHKTETHTENSNSSESSAADTKAPTEHGIEGLKPVSLRTFRITRTQTRSEAAAGKQAAEAATPVMEVDKVQADDDDGGRVHVKNEEPAAKSVSGQRGADSCETVIAAVVERSGDVHGSTVLPEVDAGFGGATRNSVIDKSSAKTPLQGQLVMKVELPKVATNITANQKPNGPADGAKKGTSEPETCPTALVDPVTGFLTPVRQSEEGTYIPAAITEEQRAAAAKQFAQNSAEVRAVPMADQPLALGVKLVTTTAATLATATEKPVVAVGPPPLIPTKPSGVETSVAAATATTLSATPVTPCSVVSDRILPSTGHLPQLPVQPVVTPVAMVAAYDQQAAIQARSRSLSMPHVQHVSSGYVGEPPVDISARTRANSVPSIPPPLTPVVLPNTTLENRDVVVDQKVAPVSRTSAALPTHRGVPAPTTNATLQNPMQSQVAQPMPSIRPLAWPSTVKSAALAQNIPTLTQVPSPRQGPPMAHSTPNTGKSSAASVLQQPSQVSVVGGGSVSSRELAKTTAPVACNPPVTSVIGLPPTVPSNSSTIKSTAPLKIHVVQPPVRASDISAISVKAAGSSSIPVRDRESPISGKSDLRTSPLVNPTTKQPQTESTGHSRASIPDISIASSNPPVSAHATSRVSAIAEGSFSDVTRGQASGTIGMPSPVGQVAKAQQQMQSGGASSPKGNVAPRHSPVVVQQASYPMTYEAALHAYGPTAAGGVTIADLLQNPQYVVHHGGTQIMPGQLVRPGTPVAVHPDMASRLGNPTPPHTPTPPSHPSLTAQGDIGLHLRHPNVVVHSHHPSLGIRHPVDMPPYMHQPLMYAHTHYAALHPELQRAQQEARVAAAMSARMQFNVRHADGRAETKAEAKAVVAENHAGSTKAPPQQQQQQSMEAVVMVKEEKLISDNPCREETSREGRRSHHSTGVDVAVMQQQQQQQQHQPQQQLVDAMSATRGKVVPPCPAATLQYAVGLPHMQRQLAPLVSVSPHDRATDSPAVANLYNQSQVRTPAHNATSAAYQPDGQVVVLSRVEQQGTSSGRHPQQLQKLSQGGAHNAPHDSKGTENLVLSNHPSIHQHHSMEAGPVQHRTAAAAGAGTTPAMYPPTPHLQHRSVSMVKQEAAVSRSETRPPDAHRPLKSRSPMQTTMRTVSPPPAHSRLPVVANPGGASQHTATGQILPPNGGSHLMPQPGSEAPQHAVAHGLTQSVVQSRVQLQTPPHASQVPPQGDSLLMLLQRYPIMWQGLLALKNDQAVVQMHFVSGNPHVARNSLPAMSEGGTPPLRIAQRMRLEQTQLEGVIRRMQMEGEHCMLLALPCGRDHMDVLQQSNNLRNGFITYLQQKQAAGIVNVAVPGSQQPAYVVHIFPSCEFSNENLNRIAPDLLHSVTDIAHLLIVIATV